MSKLKELVNKGVRLIVSETPERDPEATPAERDVPPEAFTEAESKPVSRSAVASDVEDFEAVYKEARIELPLHGYGVDKVAEMLQSKRLQTLGREVKATAVLAALEAAQVPVKDVLQDAVLRDRALDAFELAKEREVQELRAEAERRSHANKDGVTGNPPPAAKERESIVPTRADLPEVQQASAESAGSVPPVAMPGTSPGCTDRPEVRVLIWAWNAQMGLMFANGGDQSTTGSLMCQNKVNLRLVRQDDTSKMQEDLVTFANELKSGTPNPSKGAHFVSIMGDGSSTFRKEVNDNLFPLVHAYPSAMAATP